MYAFACVYRDVSKKTILPMCRIYIYVCVCIRMHVFACIRMYSRMYRDVSKNKILPHVSNTCIAARGRYTRSESVKYMKYMHDTRANTMEEGHDTIQPKRRQYTTIHTFGGKQTPHLVEIGPLPTLETGPGVCVCASCGSAVARRAAVSFASSRCVIAASKNIPRLERGVQHSAHQPNANYGLR